MVMTSDGFRETSDRMRHDRLIIIIIIVTSLSLQETGIFQNENACVGVLGWGLFCSLDT